MPKLSPILFSTEMVKEIMDGRKTMTRRIIKQKYNNTVIEIVRGNVWERQIVAPPEKLENGIERHQVAAVEIIKPTYQKGDILWVRETWTKVAGEYVYKASEPEWYTDGYRPSIHMPKEAARIFLRVTDVRAERVQDITVDDAIAEGAWGGGTPTIPMSLLWEEHPNASCNAAVSFAHLWDSLNAKRGYGWDTNPWVWVYTFERIAKPANWCAA